MKEHDRNITDNGDFRCLKTVDKIVHVKLTREVSFKLLRKKVKEFALKGLWRYGTLIRIAKKGNRRENEWLF